uniref:Uncharacterized protein n=1 Tax=Heterorhabditis bacteriophora TaxID=37862 RepID=A0A1I7XFG5_HETBA
MQLTFQCDGVRGMFQPVKKLSQFDEKKSIEDQLFLHSVHEVLYNQDSHKSVQQNGHTDHHVINNKEQITLEENHNIPNQDEDGCDGLRHKVRYTSSFMIYFSLIYRHSRYYTINVEKNILDNMRNRLIVDHPKLIITLNNECMDFEVLNLISHFNNASLINFASLFRLSVSLRQKKFEREIGRNVVNEIDMKNKYGLIFLSLYFIVVLIYFNSIFRKSFFLLRRWDDPDAFDPFEPFEGPNALPLDYSDQAIESWGNCIKKKGDELDRTLPPIQESVSQLNKPSRVEICEQTQRTIEFEV